MAEETDKDSKTEEPTEKKIRDAIEKGNTPVSREAPVLATFIASLLIGGFVLTSGARQLVGTLTHLLDISGGVDLGTNADALLLSHAVSLEIARFLAPVVAILAVAGLASAFLQNSPRIVLHRIKPDFSKLALGKGWNRLFGAQGLV